jgi:hypothetical protein
MRGELHTRKNFSGASAVSITAARLPVARTCASGGAGLPARPGRQLSQQRSSLSGCNVASDGHTHAHTSDPFMIYLAFFWYCFVIYSLFICYGRPAPALPPTPSGQAEAEQARLAPMAEWVSVHNLCPRGGMLAPVSAVAGLTRSNAKPTSALLCPAASFSKIQTPAPVFLARAGAGAHRRHATQAGGWHSQAPPVPATGGSGRCRNLPNGCRGSIWFQLEGHWGPWAAGRLVRTTRC